MKALTLDVKPSYQDYLESSLMPHAKFLRKSYLLAQSRYRWVGQYTKNKIVLDAGCGSGYGTNILAQSGAKKVYGFDLSAKAIDYCVKHYQKNNIHFAQGDLAQLDFADNFFDVIVAFEVIEHVKDCSKVIAEFFRLLKKDGRLILSTPNKKFYSPDTKKPFYPFHEREFYLDDFKNILRQFRVQAMLGQHVKGQKTISYSLWHPKRNIRVLFANLPTALKKAIVRQYLRFYFWLTRQRIYRPKKIKLSDVYYSGDLERARTLVAVCQKP